MNYDNNNLLISGLKKGDAEAYSYLVDTYNLRLCVYANSLINDKAQAEDIVQNVFMKIWEKRDGLRAGFSIKNLLYKYVYNEFVDYYRKQKSVLTLEKKYIEVLDEIIVEEVDNNLGSAIELVMKAIQELPPKCKQTILLSKKEGLSNIEISEYQQVSKRTVDTQLSKAYKLIREKLESKIEFIKI